MGAKLCAVCGGDLPPLVRIDCRYCGVRCRVRAHRLRDEAAIQRREKRRGNRADKRLRGLLNSAERKLALAQKDNASLRARMGAVEDSTSDPTPLRGQKHRASPKGEQAISSSPERCLSSAPNAGRVVIVLRRKLVEARARIATLERRMVTAAPAPLAAVASLRNEIKDLRQQNTVLRGQNDLFHDMVTNNGQEYVDIQREASKFKAQQAESERQRERLRSQAEQVPTLTAEVDRLKAEIVERKKQEDTLREERDRAQRLAALTASGWAEQARKECEERAAIIRAASVAAFERRIQRAQNAGWQPPFDPLVGEVKAEFEAADRLAKWQSERRRPVTARRMESRDDAYLLGLRAALALREEYLHHSPAGIRGIAQWRRFGYELEPESERKLVELTRKRIEKLREPIKEWGLKPW